MCNAGVWFMKAKCLTDKFKPPEEIGLTWPHNVYAVFTYIGSIRDS